MNSQLQRYHFSLLIYNLLNKIRSDKLVYSFFALNIIIGIAIFLISKDLYSGDHFDYIRLSDSILYSGTFSSFFELERDYPTTIRPPFYPLFLSLVRSISDNLLLVQIIQLALYFSSIFLIFLIIKDFSKKKLAQYLFLLISAASIQLPYYSALIYTETISIFFISSCLYVLYFKIDQKKKGIILLGLLLGALTLTKSVFFFMPFIISLFYLFTRTKVLTKIVVLNFVFLLTLSPWVYWNHTNHGKATPLTIEGGAIQAHTSFWMHKLPHNYRLPKSIYAPVIYPDLLDPFYYLYSKEDRTKNLELFLNELKEIDDSVENLLTLEQKQDIISMNNDEGIFRTYPAEYTLKKEGLYINKLNHHIKEEPYYYMISRAYTFLRVLVTGVNPDIFKDESNLSLLSKIQRVFSTSITFFLLMLPLIGTTIFYLLNLFNSRAEFHLLMFFIAYSFAVYLPFPPQSRYTIPVHLIIILVNALFLADRKQLLIKN